MTAPIDRLTAIERQAYDAIKAASADARAGQSPTPTELGLLAALEELASRRERDEVTTAVLHAAPTTDAERAERVRALLDLELDRPNADVALKPNPVNVALLTGALASLAQAPAAAAADPRVAELEDALQGARIDLDELRAAVAGVRVAMLDLGPASDLLTEGRLEPLGAALERMIGKAQGLGLVTTGAPA